MKVVRIFLAFLMLSGTTLLQAQQVFPVHATGVIIPPFSKVLSDYTGSRSQDLMFTVTLNDPVELSRDVKFIMTVKNNGREILMTNPGFNPPPLSLMQFTPEMLTGSELAPYLDVNNLVSLRGGTPSNSLPKGFTQICLEVIDFQRGVPISRQACAGGFIMDLEPPITELPACGGSMSASQTQNILFRWLPRHLGLPNAPPMVEYDFELVELLPGIADPNDGFNQAIQIYQTTVMTSSLLYTEAQPLLQANKNYAWRVRVKDVQETNLFQNSGLSNVCYFTYGQVAGPPPQAPTDCSPAITDAGPAPSPAAGNMGRISVGDEVQLGFFKLKVTQLASARMTYSGSVTIEIPFLKAQVKVHFEDLAANDQSRAYKVGKVRADYDVPMGITENDLTTEGFQNKLSQTFLQDLQTYFKHPSNQNRMVSGRSASDNSPIGLPLVLDQKDAQSNPLPPVVILDLQFTERTAKLAVVAFQKDLNTNALIPFAKTSVPFTPFGIAKQGSALPLLTTVELPMNDGSLLRIFGKDNPGAKTRANITCEGFADYDLKGEYIFSRNTILPSDNSNRKVTASLNGKIENLFDFVAKAQPKEPFQVPSLTGFTFNGNEGNFDFSAKQNPGNIDFPPNFKDGQNNSWKGFDFANASLDLPPPFDFTGQGKSMKLDEGQLIIGTGGLYGRLSKTNLIGLDKGKIEDWKISMDSLTVEVTKSQLSDSYVKGNIKVPIIDDPFEYKGNFSPGTNSGDMDIVIQPNGKGGMSLWNGEITYDPNTKVKALSRLINGKRSFIPYGDFHGKFDLNFTTDQFKKHLIGDKNSKIARLKKALGLTNEPNIQLKDALFKGLKIDPLAPQKDRYKLVDYDKINAQVTLGGKTYQPTSIQLLYEPKTQDGHNELGLEIIVAEGTNLVAITVWARKDANGNYVLNRIDTDSKVVDCDCTFLPDKNPGRWGNVAPSAADGKNVSAGGDAWFDYEKLIPPVADQFPYNNGKIEVPYLSLALEVDDAGGKLVARSQPLGNFDCSKIGVETKGTVKSLDMSNVSISTGTLQNIKNHTLSNPSKLPYDLTDSLLNLLGTNYDPTKYPWPANARLILVGFEVESTRESATGKLLLVAEGEQDEWFTFGNADVLFKPNLVGFKDLKLFLTKEKKATDPVFPFIYKKSLTNEPSDGSFAYIKCEGFQHYNVQGLFSTRHAKKASFDSKTILKTTADSLKFEFIIGGSQLAKFIAPIKSTQKEFVLKSDGGKLFSTKRGYVDYDSQQDSTGMPQAFFDKTGAPKNVFRGIYIPEAEMTVWGFYEGNGSNRKPLKMDFPSLVFRKANGFWGVLSDTEVVKPDGGDIGGWNYTVDTVDFTIENNLFGKKKMSGRLQLPIVKEKEYLPYSGIIGWNAAKKIPGAVFTTDTSKLQKLYDMPWLPGVKLNIKSGSEINFTWAVKEFIPYAKLTGAMQVRITPLDDAWKDNAPADLQKVFPLEFVIAGISFQNFNINAPEDLDSMYCGQIDPLVRGIRSISVESWGFDPSAVVQNPLPPQLTALASKLMGFGVTLDEIKMVCKEHDSSPKYKLEFVLAIDLLNENPLDNLKSGAHVPAGVVDAAKTAKNKGSRDQVIADLKKDKATLTKQFKGTDITQTKQNAAAGNAPSQAVDEDPVSDIAGLFGETNPNAPAGIGGGAAAAGGVGSGKQPPPKSLTKTTVKFNMKTNKKKGLRASGKFGIWFKNNTANYKNGFAFDHISLDELYVKAKVSFLFLEGALLVLNKDPVYGSGFKGYIDVHVSKNTSYELQATNGKPTSFKNKSKGFGGKAVAQFGSSKYNYNYGKGAKQEAKDFNYFFVDLEAFSEKGIGGKITLHGLGGGFYFNMSREISPILKDWNDLKASATGKKPTPAPPTIDYSKGAFKGLGEEVYKPGKSLSGFQYYPQPAVGGGYFKGIFSLFNFPQGISFDAAINIELGKNTAGNLTLSKIGLRGDIYSMAPSIADRRKAPGKGVIEITYDHMNRAFTGDFDWDLSIAYSPIIEISNKGAGGFLFAFHDATNVDWYVKIGKPALNQRIQSSYKFLGISGQSPRNYFQMGKMLDPLPGLKDVIPGWTGSDPQDKTLPKLGNGKGILFGTNMSLLSLDQKFLMFRARLEAALGFDVKLAQYKGISCNNEPLGVNGWYAQGLAYAYLKGGIDMEVDVPFFSGSINIFDFMLAATLQAELPKPTWMLGRIMGSYSVLNGLVEGDFKYKLELGKRCGTLAANPLAGIKMIEEVLPNDQEQDVPIYQDPIVTFTMPMGKILDVNITKSDGSFEKKGFKAYFKKFELTQNGQKVADSVNIANDYYSATFAMNELLKPKTDYKLEVTVGWKKNENGNWSEVAGATETRKVTFKTSARPDKIVAQALEYQAPGYRQRYWHKGYAYPQLLFKQSGWGYLFPKTSDDLKRELEKDGKKAEAGQIKGGIPFNYTFKLIEISKQDGSIVKVQDFPLNKFPTDETTIKSVGIAYKSGANYTYSLPYVETKEVSGKSVEFQKLNDLNLTKGSIYRIEILREPNAAFMQASTKQETQVVLNKSETTKGQEFGATVKRKVTKLDAASLSSQNSLLYKTLYEFNFGVSQYDNLADKLQDYQVGAAEQGVEIDKWEHSLKDKIPKFPRTDFKGRNRYFGLKGGKEPIDQYDEIKLLKNLILTNPTVTKIASPEWKANEVTGIHPWEADIYVNQEARGIAKGAKLHKYSTKEDLSLYANDSPVNYWYFEKWIPDMLTPSKCEDDSRGLGGLSETSFKYMLKHIMLPYYLKYDGDKRIADPQHWAFRLKFQKSLKTKLETSEILSGKLDNNYSAGQIPGMDGNKSYIFAFEDARTRILILQYNLLGGMNWRLYDSKFSWFVYNRKNGDYPWCRDPKFVKTILYYKKMAENSGLGMPNFAYTKFKPGGYDLSNKFVTWEFPKIERWKRFDESIPLSARKTIPNVVFKLPIAGNSPGVSGNVVGTQKLDVFLHHLGNEAAKNGYFFLEFQDLIASLDGIVLRNKNDKVEFYWDRKENESHTYTFKPDGSLDKMAVKPNLALIKPGENLPAQFNSGKYTVLAKIGGKYFEASFDRKNEQQKIQLTETGITAPSKWEDNLHLRIKYNSNSQKLSLATAGPTNKPGVTNYLREYDFQRMVVREDSRRLLFVSGGSYYRVYNEESLGPQQNFSRNQTGIIISQFEEITKVDASQPITIFIKTSRGDIQYQLQSDFWQYNQTSIPLFGNFQKVDDCAVDWPVDNYAGSTSQKGVYEFSGKNPATLKTAKVPLKGESVTLEVRAKFNKLSQPLAIARNSNNDFKLSVNANKEVVFEVNASGNPTCVSAAPIKEGEWTHIAAVYDFADNEMLVYINGLLSRNLIIQSKASISKSSEIIIGNEGSYGDNDMHLDAFSVFDHAVFAPDIIQDATRIFKGTESYLALHYEFLEGPNHYIVKDMSKNSAHGILSGDYYCFNSWKESYYKLKSVPVPACNTCRFEFDGKDDHVSLQNNIDLSNTSFTIEFVAERASSGTYDIVVGQEGNGTRNALHIGFRNNDNFTFAFFGDDLDMPKSAYSEDNWPHHWVCVYDAITKERKVYRDGKLLGSDKASGDYTGKGKITIGTWDLNANNYFHGTIDELRIWKTARSEQQILAYGGIQIEGTCDELFAYYDFDGGLGTKLFDRKGSNHGTFINIDANSKWVSGGVHGPRQNGCGGIRVYWSGNAGLEFDGKDDYVDLGSAVNLTNQSFTIEFWAARKSTGTNDFIVGQGQNGQNSALHIGFRDNDNFTFAFYGDDLDVPKSAYSENNSYHHWACVYNANTKEKRIYRDAQLVASGTANDHFKGSGQLTLGAWDITQSRHFHGNLDEVRIWKVVRTQQDIEHYYKKTLEGNCQDLIAYYPFNEGSGHKLTDKQGFADGTLHNFDFQSGWDYGASTPDGAVNPCGKYICSDRGFCGLFFDGVDDYATAQIQGNGLTKLSIEFWLKKENNNGGKGIFQWSNQLSDQSPWILLEDKGSNLSLYVNSGNDRIQTKALQPETWHHIAIVFDGSAWQLYTDGVLNGSYSSQIGSNTGSKIFLGSGYDGYWNGTIDEVRIWNIAKTKEDVANFKDRPISPSCPELLAYYQCDERSGDVASDKKGKATAQLVNVNTGGGWVESDRAKTQPELNVCAFPVCNTGNCAISFNGKDSYADLGDKIFTQSFTIEFWVKPSGGGAVFGLIGSDKGLKFTRTGGDFLLDIENIQIKPPWKWYNASVDWEHWAIT